MSFYNNGDNPEYDVDRAVKEYIIYREEVTGTYLNDNYRSK